MSDKHLMYQFLSTFHGSVRCETHIHPPGWVVVVDSEGNEINRITTEKFNDGESLECPSGSRIFIEVIDE